jgi:hypothetical protein
VKKVTRSAIQWHAGERADTLRQARWGTRPIAFRSPITAHQCPAGYPDGLVLVADPDLVTNYPEALVDNLLAVDDQLKSRR